ncbi:Uncharacterized protein TCAP_05979 [Tolypocladium capitatum]|uniref:Uncharacterized protein n=1 Tax=Tolypocladium capitatum TaxID=45235 RepID=A0A2K3Q9F1_9HYPO|nr:Uncharacterized protein TCAP_05979 [Tolypocladium capitatum]
MANFSWLKSVGATDQAVAVLNDQPNLFVNLILVLVGLTVQCLLIWGIHFATLKPGQKKTKKPKDNATGGARRK